jgi:hypothetical protein
MRLGTTILAATAYPIMKRATLKSKKGPQILIDHQNGAVSCDTIVNKQRTFRVERCGDVQRTDENVEDESDQLEHPGWTRASLPAYEDKGVRGPVTRWTIGLIGSFWREFKDSELSQI